MILLRRFAEFLLKGRAMGKRDWRLSASRGHLALYLCLNLPHSSSLRGYERAVVLAQS